MKFNLKTISLSILILLVLLTIATYLYFRHEINQSLGGNTQQVDSSLISPITGPIAITNVNVLSIDAKSMRPNQTVMIEAGKIVSISQNSEISNNYHVVNGKNKYLIPGLVDSHVHLKKSKNDLLLYVANGITQVAEMTGMEHHFDYIEEISKGSIGPGIFVASPKITSQKGWYPTVRSIFEKRHQNYLSPSEGRDAVKKYKSMGYQAIKLSSDLSPDIYYAVNDEAQKQKIPVIGHLPVGLQLKDLYQSGQSQLSHIDSITHNLMNEFGGITEQNHQQFLSHIKSSANLIASKFKEQNIFLASTVWLHKTRQLQAYELQSFFKTIPLEYQNPGWLESSAISKGCLPGGNAYEYASTDSAKTKQYVSTYLKTYNEAIKIITQSLIVHGVPITAGTDSLGACGMIAGFSLHKELQALNQIGLSNSQVLKSATSIPSEWMGTNAGLIKKGYQADLVLLNKNPLVDISNTQTIESVIVNGKYLDRKQLNNILAAVKKANNMSRNKKIDQYLL
jgi:hypothetical protein